MTETVKTMNVLEYEVRPRRHRIAWWVVRPLVALLFCTIIGIPIGMMIGAAAAKPWQEHRMWKAERKAAKKEERADG